MSEWVITDWSARLIGEKAAKDVVARNSLRSSLLRARRDLLKILITSHSLEFNSSITASYQFLFPDPRKRGYRRKWTRRVSKSSLKT